jgi:hypothetical protein
MHKATVVVCTVLSLVVIGGTAAAGQLITSGDIKNGTITNKDIKKKTIKLNRLDQKTQDKINAPGPAGAQGPAGPAGVQGPPGPAAATDFGVASVFVQRGVGNPKSRFATYSVPLGAPTGSTIGGQFRFTCSTAQAPCHVSIGAAVVSTNTGNVAFYPRLTIHKEDQGVAPPAPSIFCEYADGTNNNVGFAQVPRVPTLAAAVTETRATALNMGVGGSLDCGANQVDADGIVTEIDVPAGSGGQSAFYDVWVTFAFGDIPVPDVPDTP